ncbi:MAG: tRNA (N6-threonylcarbamoyladenosine(37)-N6)-methyltransferase TrmO [Polyangiales bacterium]
MSEQRDNDPAAPWTFTPLGVARTVFREKYSIPRQPGLCAAARGTLQLRRDDALRAALKGIEGFSHLWVLYVFHATGAEAWRPTVRAPRLGGAQKVGVLASRSPHRPNPIGMSVVELLRAELDHPEGPRLEVRGVDLLDGSPVLDVKPYLPYADAVRRARVGWAREPVPRVAVRFTRTASAQVRTLEATRPELRALIRGLLSLDPRPAFQQRRLPVGAPAAQGTRWGFSVLDLEVRWEIAQGAIVVREVTPASEPL